MSGEGEIRAALRNKAGGHLPLSVTTSISTRRKTICTLFLGKVSSTYTTLNDSFVFLVESNNP
jgi:hypothetical protein